jgi:hypothetical protein
MIKLIGGAAALTLLVGCASTAPAPAELAAADGEKVVCKYEIVTGSNRKERICATEATWAEANEIRREQADEQTTRANRRYTDTFRAIEADAGNSGN